MKGYLTFKRSMLALGVSGAALAYSQVHKIDSKLACIKHKLETNGKEPIMELTTRQSAYFPWEFDPSSIEQDDWEFRRVQVKGGLLATRHYVKRDKGTRPGYLVFGAMITSQQVVKDLEMPYIAEPTIGSQNGIIVCLGWVPEEATHKGIGDYMVQEDIVLMEDLYSESKIAIPNRFQDPYTGFIYQTAVDDDPKLLNEELYDFSDNPNMRKAAIALNEFARGGEPKEGDLPGIAPLSSTSEMSVWGKSKLDSYMGYYHMRGYLRKGEDSDWLLGRVNKGIRNVSRVDIAKIAGFYRFRNPSAYEYYIDKSTDDDNAYNTVLPQPNHLNKGFEHLEPFDKDSYYDGYKRMIKYSSALAVLALLI